MMAQESPFANIAKVSQDDLDRQGGGRYFPVGNFVAKIAAAKYLPAKKSKKGEGAMIFTCDVLESDTDKLPAGTKAVSIVMKENSFYYWTDLKALLMAAFQTNDPTDVDEPLCELVADPKKQAANGKIIKIQGTAKTTEKGVDIAVLKYFAHKAT